MSQLKHQYQSVLLVAISIMLTGVLSACVGTSQKTNYYALDSEAVSEMNDGEVLIAVGPFEIPDYLDRTQIVTRGEGTQLQILKFDRWAEPLGVSISRQVNNDINQQLKSAFAYQFPSVSPVRPAYKVRGRIHSFEANSDGVVNLRLRWGILDTEGHFAIPVRGANFSTTVESVDDIAAVTAAMGSLVDQLGDEIVAELRKLGLE
jgi:uncharacterized lipoprotein YmbA